MSVRGLYITVAVAVCFVGFGYAAGFDTSAGPDIKCGTPAVLELLGKRGKIASYRMDNLACSALSAQKHFRVHYDTTGYHAPLKADMNRNNVPDFIDSTLVYVEHAWDIQVNQLGYRPPKSDGGAGGGDEIDIYVRNFGSGGYAVTYPDRMDNGTSSAYIIIDNDYQETQYGSKGYAALRVTTAHEFFHGIQFGYTANMSLIWWMEQSATWMEDRIWNDVNDYMTYLQYFFPNASKYSLDSGSIAGNFMYGAVVWPMYLANRFGDKVVRDGWEVFAGSSNYKLSGLDPIIPGGLNAALNEFGVWNYFTRERAVDGWFYPDAHLFQHTMNMDLSAAANPARDSLLTRNFTSSYIEFLFLGGWNGKDALQVQSSTENGRIHENSLILYNTPSDFRIHRFTQQDATIPLEKSWNRAILVTTCVNPVDPGGRFRFSADWTPFSGVESQPQYAFSVRDAVPNPFNPATTIRFVLPGKGNVQ
ncbi:MAG: MXAN_6640 family putative metalloprotease, partial [Candidatus Latescibacterota bacterium]